MGTPTLLTLVRGLLLSGVFLFIGLSYFQGLDHWTLQPDEHIYLREGEFLELFATGKWSHPIWSTFEAFDHPSVGGYVYGVGLAISGHWPIGAYFAATDFNEGLELSRTDRYDSFSDLWRSGQWWNEASGRPLVELKAPFPAAYATLMVGRYTAVILSLLGLVFAFLWLSHYFSWLISSLGVMLVAFHPLSFQEETLPRAMLEAPLFFFTALAGYVITLWLKQPDKHPVRLGVAVGAIAALAAGVKLTGVVMVFGLLVFWLLVWLRKIIGPQTGSRFFTFGPSVAVSFLSLFYLLNPQLYLKPWVGLWRFYATRQGFSLWQQYHPLGDIPLFGLDSRLKAGVGRLLLGNQLSMQYGWAHWLLAACFFIGIGYLSSRVFRLFWELKTEKEEFIFWWAIVSFWLIVTYLPLDSARYLQPLVLPTVFLQLFGVQAIITGALWLFRSRSGKGFLQLFGIKAIVAGFTSGRKSIKARESNHLLVRGQLKKQK